MSIYSNVTEKDLDNLRKLADQQKEQRALKIKNRILKQTHDEKLAESLSPITKRLDLVENKKGEKIGDLIKKSESETPAIENPHTQLAIENIQPISRDSESQTPKLVSASDELVKTFSKMNDSKNFFKVIRDAEGNFSWNNKEVIPLGGNRVKIEGEEFNITPEIQKAFTDTRYNFNNTDMDDENVLIFYKILNSLNYDPSQDSNSKRTKSIKNDLKKRVHKINNPLLTLQGEGVKTIIPSNIIGIYTRLEVLLGLKLSGHTDTLTEASNLIDELYKLGEIQNKRQYRNALDKFLTH